MAIRIESAVIAYAKSTFPVHQGVGLIPPDTKLHSGMEATSTSKWIALSLAIAATVSVLSVVACFGGSNEATPAPVIGSAPGGIAGTVTGLDGEPVAGVRVAIVSGTTTFPEIAPETDQQGRYQIGGVPPGTFEVAVHDREGQRVGQSSVTVTSGETATLDFSVSTVTGGQQAPPASVKSSTDGLCLPA